MANNTSQATVYAAPADETAAERYDRDIAQMGTETVPEPGIADDRADRLIGQQNEERTSRLYVDYDSGTSATGAQNDDTDALIQQAKKDHSNPIPID